MILRRFGYEDDLTISPATLLPRYHRFSSIITKKMSFMQVPTECGWVG